MKVYRWSRAGLTGRCQSETSRACCAVVYCRGGQTVSFRHGANPTAACAQNAPRQQDALVLLQLLHEGRVGFGDSTSLFHIVEGRVQVPAVLLHGVGDDRGGGAAHTHLTVNQTLHTGFSRETRKRKLYNMYCGGWGGTKACRCLLGFGDELVGIVPVLQQVGGLLVVNSDVVVLKHPREEVVYFPGHIQDVAHSASDTQRRSVTGTSLL